MLLSLVIALLPLLITPGLLFYFDVTPKIAVLLMGVAVALPWLAPGRLMARREGRWLYMVLAIQAVSLAMSTAISSRLSISIFGTSWRRFGLITQLALLLFTAIAAADLAGNRRRLQLYLRAIAAAALPISLYGIAQYFGWDPLMPKEGYHIGEGFWTIVRPPGTLGYVSYFANYMVFAVFLGAALYSIEEARWWKFSVALAATLAGFAVVLSGTRGAMLGMAAGGVFLWLWFRRPVRMRGIAVAAGAAAALALFVISPAGHMMRTRFRWFQEDALGGARLLLFRDSLTLASNHLLAGIGPETFSAEFPKHQSIALSRAYPDFYHESPHNILLDALTAQGVLGFFGLAAFIGLGFYCASEARAREPVLTGILGACLLAGLIVHQFTVFTAPTAVYFYLVVAMLVGLCSPAGGQAISLSHNDWRRLAVWVPVSAVFFLVALRLVLADWELERVRGDLNAGNGASAILRYSRVRNLGLYADIWYSNQMANEALKATEILAALKSWQQALESGMRATKTADDPQNAWYRLSSLHARENQFASTERALRGAISTSPTWFKPHWMLAQILMTKGRREEAESEAKLAVSLDGGKNPEVTRTLEEIQAKNK